MNQSTSKIDSSSLRKFNRLLEKVRPLVDDLADALGTFLIVCLMVIVWIFIDLYLIRQYALAISLSLTISMILPWLILVRIWFALENLKQIPEQLSELAEDISENTSTSFSAVKSGKKGLFNVLKQARTLFQIRTLLNTGSEFVEQYFSIGPLVNPFYLLFAVISLITLFFVLVTGVVLALALLF